jgi:hypothetical protein
MLEGAEGDFQGTARFKILRRIGAGGMGVVYEAFDNERSCRVALKTLRRPGGEELLRLKAEFRALQDVQHRNLVSLGELREESGAWFFTMELVEGVSFLEWVRPASGAPSPLTPSSSSDRRGGDSAEPLATASTWRQTAAQRLWDSAVGAPMCDEERLRMALRQLATGVSALHVAGKVHRDIKPSNVLVTPDGRLVLLDFGLVTGTDLDERSSVAHPVGTVAYMAPEQAAAQPVGPAADWYAIGVMLYQALTCTLPFDGAPIEVMVQKQTRDGAAPRTLVPEVPADLDELCRDLLRCDPAARPTGPQVLDRLGVAASASTRLAAVAAPTLRPLFVGRRAELELLRTALDTARRGTPQAVLVGGESGVGKSALVRCFTDQLREEVPGVVVLSGRCYEREYVPFRAIDGVIDALARFMTQVGETEAGCLLPRAAGLLGQVFPVLRRVKAVAQAPRPDANIDPQELRRRLFGAVRELLVRLADRHPVVVTIDDLQWADADSLALASEVVRPPDAPGLLIIGTRRDQPDDALAVRAPHVEALLAGFTHRVSLGPLPRDEARRLATQLAERMAVSSSVHVDAIAAEAGGHPLFIDELVRHAAADPTGAGASLRLDDVLRARVAGLPPASRRVLELLAVAGSPTPQVVVERAADIGADEFPRCVAALRSVNLVVTARSGTVDTIAPYHDRIREALLAKLPESRGESYHRDLALAFEAGEHPDPEQLAVHWQGAGEDERAARHFLRAAAQAEEALAFEHAAKLYQATLDLHPSAKAARQVRVRLGHALANAGRGGRAAEMFLLAAADAPEVEALELRRRAAEQYLRSGHLDEGLDAIRSVLPALGLSFPSTPRRALLSALWQRARVRLRGLRFQPQSESQVAPGALARLDAALSIAGTLGVLDQVRGTDFNARLLRAALRVGESKRLLRALSLEAVYVASNGPAATRRSQKLLKLAHGLVGPESDEFTRVYPRLAEGMSLYFRGCFREALAVLQAIDEPLRSRCQGGAWEHDQVIVFSLFAKSYLGRMREVAQEVPRHAAEGLDRGDLYLASVLSLSILNAAWLVDDDPATARRMASDAIAAWSFRGPVVHAWYAPTAMAQLELYEGDGAAALAHVERAWPALERSLLLRVDLVNAEARQLRARVALAVAAAGGKGAEQERRAAARDGAWLRRQRGAWKRALGAMIVVGAEACAGRATDALPLLEGAERGFAEAGLALHAAVARRRRGELLGGDEGRALVAAADEWMRGQRIKNPARMAALLAPGFHD